MTDPAPPKNLLHSMARWPAHRPVATLLVAAMALLLAAWSVSRLSFDPKLESLLSSDSASTDSLAHVIHDFHLLDEALVLVEVPATDSSDTPEAQESRAARLEAFAQRLVDRIQSDEESPKLIESIEYRAAADVRQFIEQIAVPHAMLYLDDAAFDAVIQRLSPSVISEQMQRNETMIAAGSPAADKLSKQILRDPLRLHDILIPGLAAMRPELTTWRGSETYLSPNVRSLLVRITAKGAATNMNFTRQLMALLRRATDAAAPGDLVIHYGGAYAIAQYSEQHIRSNMIASITGTIILMQILFILAHGRLRSFPLVFVPVAGGVLVGFGIYGAIFGEISPITAGIGAILAGLGVDYSIHFLAHYEAARGRGQSAQQATDMRGGIGTALVHACATSMIGFLAIMASTIPALRDFALLGALGLAGALLASLTVLPALLVLLDRSKSAGTKPPIRLNFQPFLRLLSDHAATRFIGPAMLGIALILALLNWNGSPWFASDVRLMHPQPNAPLDTQDRIARGFGLSTESMLVHLNADSPGSLLALSQDVNDSLAQTSLDRFGVKAMISPATFLPDTQRAGRRIAILRELDRSQILASFREAVARSLFNPKAFASYESFLQALLDPTPVPDWSTLSRYPTLARMMLPISTLENGEKLPTHALAFVQLSRPMKSLNERDELVDALRKSLASLPGAQLTGLTIVSRDIELAVRRELPRIGLVAMVLVILWVAALYRKPVRVLMALAPVFITALFVLAVLRVTSTGLNMINMAAIPILVGTAIDNGIFLVSTAANHQKSEGESLLAALADRCHAMTLCSVTTIIGFGSLMFTSVPAIASLGLMLAWGMIGCWMASVLMVAPMLIRMDRVRNSEALHG